MMSVSKSNRPIQLRHEDSDKEYVSDQVEDEHQVDMEGSQDESENSSDKLSDEPSDQDQQSEDGSSDATSEDEEPEELKNISFGALAKAQEAFAPATKSRKRKLTTLEQSSDQKPSSQPIDQPHPTIENLSKKPKQDLTTRGSKHAPAVLSSRFPVSRKREIFSPPAAQKSRDPRFDPAITSRTLNETSISQADKAYSFLTDYQATEILALKSEIKKSQTKDPDRATELKKKLMSMESRLRNAQTKSKEREVLRKHKAQEKQAIKEGKKSRPYFLKKSDVRKEVERDRVEGMGKKQKETMEKRKRMREKRKEARDMPWARRMG